MRRVKDIIYNVGRIIVAFLWIIGVPCFVYAIGRLWSPWDVLGAIAGIWIYAMWEATYPFFVDFRRHPVKSEYRWKTKTVYRLWRDKNNDRNVRLIIRLPYWKYVRDWRFH